MLELDARSLCTPGNKLLEPQSGPSDTEQHRRKTLRIWSRSAPLLLLLLSAPSIICLLNVVALIAIGILSASTRMFSTSPACRPSLELHDFGAIPGGLNNDTTAIKRDVDR